MDSAWSPRSSARARKIRFVAGATRRIEKAARFAAEHGFPLAADYRAILSDPEIDAIMLATPHSLHAEQVKQAARLIP